MRHQYHIEVNPNNYISNDVHGKWSTTDMISQAKKFSSSEISTLSENFEQKFGMPIDRVKVIPILNWNDHALNREHY